MSARSARTQTPSRTTSSCGGGTGASRSAGTSVREIAEHIASLPAVTVKMAREVIRHLAVPAIRSSMSDEMIYQTFVNKSDDIAELRAARAEDREPRYTGS